MIKPIIINLLSPCRVLRALIANVNPGIARPKIINPKKGNPQIISLPPLPKGGISNSDRKTRTSIPRASIPVSKGKYFFTPLHIFESNTLRPNGIKLTSFFGRTRCKELPRLGVAKSPLERRVSSWTAHFPRATSIPEKNSLSFAWGSLPVRSVRKCFSRVMI